MEKCGICFIEDIMTSSDFHHLDPMQKDFTIGKSYCSLDKDFNELKKCVLLCINCHREVHANYTKIPENIQRFDRSLIKDTYKNISLYEKCPYCVKLKPLFRITCSKSCAGKLAGKLSYISISKLKEIVNNTSITEVTKQLNVSHGSILKNQTVIFRTI